MSASLLERMARTLCDRDGQAPTQWEAHLPTARALLEVIREPDVAMLEAGAVVVKAALDGQSEAAREEDAANIWRYMVGAALGS